MMSSTEAKTLKLVWKLENYSYCWHKNNEYLQSPTFPANALWTSSWFLRLYPRGVSSYKNYVSVHLGRLRNCEGPLGIAVDYEIALLRSDGKPEFLMETKQRCIRRGHAFGFDKLASWEELLVTKKSIMLPEDTLTVQCRIFPKKATLKTHTEITAKTCLELERFVFTVQTNFESRSFEGCIQTCSVNRAKGSDIMILKLFGVPNAASKTLEYSFWGYGSGAKAFHSKIGIVDSNNTVSTYLMDKHCYRNLKDIFEEEPVTSITLDEIRKRKSFFLPGGKLTLHYDLSVSFGAHHGVIETVICDNALTYVPGNLSFKLDLNLMAHSSNYNDNYSALKNDLRNLYQEGTIADFTIKVGCESIQVHKAVLCARSPVFKAMLTSNMKENTKNTMDISDLEVDTVLNMLSYMYTDKIDSLDWEKASKLYYAADKYALMSLKLICSDFLKQNLCVENVRAIITLGIMHADDNLKQIALVFICDHQTEVMCSEKWNDFIANESQLAAEIMQQILLKKPKD